MKCPNCTSDDIVEIIGFESDVIKVHPLYFKKPLKLFGCYDCTFVWVENMISKKEGVE